MSKKSRVDKVRDYLGNLLSTDSAPPKESTPTEHKLSTTRKINTLAQSRSTLLSQLEERRKSTVSKTELEALYHIDGLTFRMVNKYVDSMIGPGFYFEGRKYIVDIVDDWARRVRLKRRLEEIIKDIFVTGCGNAWVNLGYTEDSKDIPILRIINPKTNIDYLRDSKTHNVLLDKDNLPIGFKQERSLMGHEVTWTKDKITVGGESKWSSTTEDGRDRIAHFKLFGLGESYLGMSPLESIYRDAVIRLNLTDNIGETGFRGGAIIGYVGADDPNATPVPDKEIDKLADDLTNISHQDIFVFQRNRVKLDTMPIPDLKGREDLVYYFVDVQCAGIGIPLTLLLEPKRAFKGEVEFKAMEFEKAVEALQEKLAEQVEDQLISRMLKARGIDPSKTPVMKFRSFQPAMRLSRSRRLGKYVKDGVINWDER